MAGAHAWHAQPEAAPGHTSAVAMGLRMALLQNQMDVEVGTVASDLARVQRDHDQLMQQYPPPRRRRVTAAALDANFGAEEESS